MLRTLVICFACSTLFSLQSFAQSKRDYNWLLGYMTGLTGMPNTDEYGGVNMTFTQDTVSIGKFDIFSGPPTTVMNDEAGHLLFYATGCSIYNRNFQVMEGGDDINVGSIYRDEDCSLYNQYIYTMSGYVTLPIPENPDRYLMLYKGYFDIVDSFPGQTSMFAAEIDLSYNGGLGKVLYKDSVLLGGHVHDAVAAVRHGNGRDWWVIFPYGPHRQFWKILVGPHGVDRINSQTMPPPYSPYTVVYKVQVNEDPPLFEDLIPYEAGFEAQNAQAVFSPDGTKYCRVIRSGDVEIYDFDRCSGELKLRRLLALPMYTETDVPLKCAGLCVSPNSRYLYFNNDEGLFQFDMCEECIESVDFKLIEYYDGFVDPIRIPVDFFQMRNAPDGKIYMTAPNTTPYLHVIEKPNEPGERCQFKQHGVELPRYTSWIINYFPNYNLYDVAESPCDTLGIDDPNPPKTPLTFKTFKIFPNPAQTEVMLFVPQCDDVKIRVWNIAGQLIKEIPFIPGLYTYPLSVSDWPSGTYIVAAYIDAEKPVIQKLIVAH